MSTLHEIASEADFETKLSSISPSTLLVLSFHTPWAAPCTQMRTILETLASLYPATTPPSISFLSINAEELPDISEKYDVTAVPFLVLVRDNTVLQNISGSDPIKVREAIEKHYQATATGGAGAEKQSIPPPLNAVAREQPEPSTSGNSAGMNGTPGTTTEEPTPPSREELFARLAELVKAASVMLFMKGTPSAPQCGFSRQLVGILRENNVKYGFFNILADEDVRQGLKEFADWPTFPQLWVKGELVGGLDIVKEEIQDNPDFLNDYAVPRATAA